MFAKQLRQLGVTFTWVGSPSNVNITALKLAGPALYGTFGVAGLQPRTRARRQGLRASYEAAYKVAAGQSLRPGPTTRSWCWRGDQQGGQEPTRRRSAKPSSRSRSYQGAEGEYKFDPNGDGLHGYNIVRNENGTIVFDKHIEAAF